MFCYLQTAGWKVKERLSLYMPYFKNNAPLNYFQISPSQSCDANFAQVHSPIASKVYPYFHLPWKCLPSVLGNIVREWTGYLGMKTIWRINSLHSLLLLVLILTWNPLFSNTPSLDLHARPRWAVFPFSHPIPDVRRTLFLIFSRYPWSRVIFLHRSCKITEQWYYDRRLVSLLEDNVILRILFTTVLSVSWHCHVSQN